MRLLYYFVAAAVLLVGIPSALGQGAPTRGPHEVILLPLALEGVHSSAAGATWVTEFVIRNNSDRAVSVVPVSCGSVECPAEFFLLPLETRTDLPIYFQRQGSPLAPGSFLQLERQFLTEVSLSLHLRNMANPSGWGTQLPLIPASEAFSSTARTLNVPTDASFRQTLRIYDFDAQSSSSYRIRFYDQSSDELLHELVVVTARGTQGDGPIIPGYAQVDRLTEAFPVLARAERLSITVEPVEAGKTFWYFVSVTDNVTNDVTLFTP